MVIVFNSNNPRGCSLPPHYLKSNVLDPALKATGLSTVSKTISTIFEGIGIFFTPKTPPQPKKKSTQQSHRQNPLYKPNSPIRTQSEFEVFREKLYQYDGDDPNFHTRQFELFLYKKTSPKNP